MIKSCKDEYKLHRSNIIWNDGYVDHFRKKKHHYCIVSYPAIKIIMIKTSVIVGSQNNKSTKRKNRELIQVGNWWNHSYMLHVRNMT